MCACYGWFRKGICRACVDKHNGSQVLLFYNNLAAHASNVAKAIFAAGKVFLYYFLSSTIESVKPTKASYSILLQCKTGDLLDP